VSEPLKAGRDVDPVAVDVVALDDHIAKIDADAKFDALVFRHVLVALGHAALNRHGAFDRVHDAGELDQRAVAHQFDDAPSILSDGRINESLTECLEARERSRLVGPNEPAVADHIYGEDRGQLALDLCRHGAYPTSLQDLLFQLGPILSRLPWLRESPGAPISPRIPVRARYTRQATACSRTASLSKPIRPDRRFWIDPRNRRVAGGRLLGLEAELPASIFEPACIRYLPLDFDD
jgi:hypothetical protein